VIEHRIVIEAVVDLQHRPYKQDQEHQNHRDFEELVQLAPTLSISIYANHSPTQTSRLRYIGLWH
jgi:hypothetical protein